MSSPQGVGSVPGTVLVTGASSGVGLFATKALADRGWHVVMACRDPEKARRAQAALAIPDAAVTHLRVDLGDLDSVRELVTAFHATGLPLDALVINAAVYIPPSLSPAGGVGHGDRQLEGAGGQNSHPRTSGPGQSGGV
jgi:protochlorophyllide reductase